MTERPSSPGQDYEIPQAAFDKIGAFSHELAAQLGVSPERLAQVVMGAVRQELHASTEPTSAEASRASAEDARFDEPPAPEQSVERRRAVEAILATPGVSIALYGKFDPRGVSGETIAGYYDDTLGGQAHWATDGRDVEMEPRGNRNMPFFWGRRAAVQTDDDKLLPPFEGVVVEKTSADVPGSPIAFSLTYVDTESNDRRPGVTTTCTVVLPKGAGDTIDAIRGDSSLMIDLMRRAFPEADRSQGELKVTDNLAKTHLSATVDRRGNLAFV